MNGWYLEVQIYFVLLFQLSPRLQLLYSVLWQYGVRYGVLVIQCCTTERYGQTIWTVKYGAKGKKLAILHWRCHFDSYTLKWRYLCIRKFMTYMKALLLKRHKREMQWKSKKGSSDREKTWTSYFLQKGKIRPGHTCTVLDRSTLLYHIYGLKMGNKAYWHNSGFSHFHKKIAPSCFVLSHELTGVKNNIVPIMGMLIHRDSMVIIAGTFQRFWPHPGASTQITYCTKLLYLTR